MGTQNARSVVADARRVNYCLRRKTKYGILKCVKIKWNRIFAIAGCLVQVCFRCGIAMKNWEGKNNLQLPPLFQFTPHLLGTHALFALQLRPCML